MLSSFLLAACGGSSSAGVPETNTPVAGDTPASVVATSTRVSTPTSRAETPQPPSPAPTVNPTATPTSTATPTRTATPEEDGEPAGRYDDLGDFQAALDDLLRDVDGTVAVSLLLPDGTVLWEVNAGESMEAASLYKLAVMVEIYRQQAEGMLSFDDAVELTGAHFNEGEDSYTLDNVGAFINIETLMTSMIAHSSNVAAYALLGLAGSANVNATMIDLGLDGIEIRWSPRDISPLLPAPDEPEEDDMSPEESDPEPEPEINPEELDEPESDGNVEPSGAGAHEAAWLSYTAAGWDTLRGDTALNVVRSSDLARLLVLMLNGTAVSEWASQQMLDMLGRQEIYGGLPAYLPEGTVAHKTGYLEDGVVNDAGVVYTPHGPIVAVVLTEGTGEAVAYEIASRIGLLLYQLGSD